MALFIWNLASWANSSDPLFPLVNGNQYYFPSYQGYGFLTNTSSEAGLITAEQSLCEETALPLTESLTEYLLEENYTYQELLKLILNPYEEISNDNKKLHQFSRLLNHKDYFYSNDQNYKKRIYKNDKSKWNEVSRELKALTDKYLHLVNALDPENILKAELTLAYYENKKKCMDQNECIEETNTQNLIRRSFFLLNPPLRKMAQNTLMNIFKWNENEYEKNLHQIKHPMELTTYSRKINKAITRAQRLPEKMSQEMEIFLKQHSIEIQKEIAREIKNINEIPPHVTRQVYIENAITQCGPKEIQYQCNGVIKEENQTKVGGQFFLQGFRAYRDFTITEENLNDKTYFQISAQIPLVIEDGIDRKRVEDTISKWKKWLHEFYNVDPKYRFQFNIQIEESTNEKNILLHQCYNTSYQSTDCQLPTQPNAHHYTLSMDKDVILEEIGHRMGLFDEYSYYYFIFNPQGATDSFMIAKDNYRIYPHHIEQILLPHLICR